MESSLKEEEEFESLKENFIKETLSLLTTLKEMDIDEVKQMPTKVRIALLQAESAATFAELCKYIMALQ